MSGFVGVQVLHGKEYFDLMTGRRQQNRSLEARGLRSLALKNVRVSALTTQGRNPDNFLVIFWKKLKTPKKPSEIT